jgi:hypothetical protein
MEKACYYTPTLPFSLRFEYSFKKTRMGRNQIGQSMWESFGGIGGGNNRNPIDPIATSNVELTMMRIEKSVDKYVIHMYVCMYVKSVILGHSELASTSAL